MKVGTYLGLIAMAVALSSARAAAHHSFSMFDMDKNIEYSGVLMEWKWQNPHVHFKVEIKPGPGLDPQLVGTWDVEGGSTTIMGRQGWTRSSYKVGDAIKLIGHPMRDGSKGVSLFYAIRPDGSRLYHDIARPADDKK